MWVQSRPQSKEREVGDSATTLSRRTTAPTEISQYMVLLSSWKTLVVNTDTTLPF